MKLHTHINIQIHGTFLCQDNKPRIENTLNQHYKHKPTLLSCRNYRDNHKLPRSWFKYQHNNNPMGLSKNHQYSNILKFHCSMINLLMDSQHYKCFEQRLIHDLHYILNIKHMVSKLHY
jgi:hypothetical protein